MIITVAKDFLTLNNYAAKNRVLSKALKHECLAEDKAFRPYQSGMTLSELSCQKEMKSFYVEFIS